MKYATVVSVIIFVFGINSAVFLHHYYKGKEIEKKNTYEMELKSKLKTTPYIFHYAGKESGAMYSLHIVSIKKLGKYYDTPILYMKRIRKVLLNMTKLKF